MEFLPENLEYSFRKAESAYLVWLKDLNRYLHLEEPAFWVAQQFQEGNLRQKMISECSQRYLLTLGEAERFIGEIEEEFQNLYRDYQKPEIPSIPYHSLPLPSLTPVERVIAINGSKIRFSFGDSSVEHFIFPLFNHLEIPSDPTSCELLLEVFKNKGKLYLIKNKNEAFTWPVADLHKLKGALQLEVITLIHQTTLENWMGVIHASSVSKGKGAVMFPAQPGAGKSTLAALLMAHGCELVSDDFTPMALENQHIYSFPGAISVKEGSMSLLKSYFPQLDNAPKTYSLSKGKEISFLATAQPMPAEDGYGVNAIVFVQYQKQTECLLERVNNLDVINDFLTESWLANHGRAAEKFMEWYLETPCYKLRYGNHQKAIESIQKLF